MALLESNGTMKETTAIKSVLGRPGFSAFEGTEEAEGLSHRRLLLSVQGKAYCSLHAQIPTMLWQGLQEIHTRRSFTFAA